MKKIAVIFGTRPEAVKLCPLVLELRKRPGVEVVVCVTGQHREMVGGVLDFFGVRPEVDLGLMRENQTLAGLTGLAVGAVDGFLREARPEAVVVQGDTTTAFCAALAAFYLRVPVAHVEAGLRTGNRFSPFPEEVNRVFVSRLADWHFAPTEWARGNLLREGVAEARVWVTGNTGIDALQVAVRETRNAKRETRNAQYETWEGREMVLITGHRRENFGGGFEGICAGISGLAEDFPEAAFVYPVHLNPNVKGPVHRMLGGRKNIYLIEPVGYLEFVGLLDRCKLVLTDSGGVQEEAPSLGKPVLVMRETTERPEGVEAGTVKLVGTDAGRIRGEAGRLLRDGEAYGRMSRAVNPYGDGRASERIVDVLSNW